MPQKNTYKLSIKIQNQQSQLERTLAARDKLTLGLSPDNDITVFDSDFPKSHPLIEHNGSSCRLYIHPKMKGAVRYQDSTLAFQDLIVQDLLPRKGNFYILDFSQGRKGVVDIGDTRVGFLFEKAPIASSGLPTYSWGAATRRALAKDLLFKFLLVIFIALEVMWGVHIRNVELPPEEPPESAVVPQRFARFMLQQEPVAPPIESTLANNSGQTSDDAESSDDASSESNTESSGTSREKAVASAGLLGLIGGSGSSENASAAVDFLLDQGLVKELDELLGTQTSLQSGRVGRNRNGGTSSSSGDGLDDLLDFGASGGIDDLIADDAGVQKVNLEKKGDVNIETPQSMRGSEAARGQRSAESVMSVINSQHGRVMYTYNKHLRQDPNMRGKVSVDVTIAANGRVTDVQVVESTIQNADFVRDLLTIIRQLRFPSISEGSITVNVPFVFNRVN